MLDLVSFLYGPQIAFNQGVLGSSPSALTNNQSSKTSNPRAAFGVAFGVRVASDRLMARQSSERRSTPSADLPKAVLECDSERKSRAAGEEETRANQSGVNVGHYPVPLV